MSVTTVGAEPELPTLRAASPSTVCSVGGRMNEISFTLVKGVRVTKFYVVAISL